MGRKEDENVGRITGTLDGADRRQRELEQFEAIVQAFPEPVIVTDAGGRLTFGNRAFVERFGYDIDDRHVSEFVADDDVDGIVDLLREMVTAGTDEPETVVFEGLTADGRTLVLEGTITLLPGDCEFDGVAVVLRDVTAEQRRQEVFAVMNRTLRHNLRNTVTVINASLDILDQAIESEHAEVIERIDESTAWLQTLADRLRTIRTAIDESLERDETRHVEHIVESSIEAATGEDTHADVTTHYSVDGELAAPIPVGYAIENLVENAIVHSDQETPTVDVWVTHAARDGWVDVLVGDDGPGIPKLERDVVLGDATIDPLQHGSGMGLWIARWVVEVFGGRIDIEDNDPRGSVVTLRLPLAGSDSSA